MTNNRYIPKPTNYNKNGTCFVQGEDIYGSPRTFKSWEWDFVKCRKDGVDI